jgi:hypothetical protein
MPFPAFIGVALGIIDIVGRAASQFGGKKTQRWIDVGLGVIGGVKEHVQVKQTLEHWRDTGHTPTQAELDALDALADKAHANLQQKGKESIDRQEAKKNS